MKLTLDLMIESLATLISERATNIQKQAATLILKCFIPSSEIAKLLDDGGVYPVDRNDSRVRAWRKSILSKGVCEICGAKENLEAHHIVKWSSYPQGRADLKNGACLCHKCHAKEHIGEQVYYLMKAR